MLQQSPVMLSQRCINPKVIPVQYYSDTWTRLFYHIYPRAKIIENSGAGRP